MIPVCDANSVKDLPNSWEVTKMSPVLRAVMANSCCNPLETS